MIFNLMHLKKKKKVQETKELSSTAHGVPLTLQILAKLSK